MTKHTAVEQSESEGEPPAAADSAHISVDISELPHGKQPLLKSSQVHSVILMLLLTSMFTGTVVVKPEPVANETKDEFKGPEFRNRGTSKVKDEASRKRPGEQSHVNCT